MPSLAFLGTVDKKTGWVLMELPVLATVLGVYIAIGNFTLVSTIVVGAFVCHYVNRALIFPYRIRVTGKTMPVFIVLATMVFYVVNGWFVAYYFGALKTYPPTWLSDPRFVVGAGLFLVGFVINVTSDNILIRLREPGKANYKIPHGGLFRYVSCPNYFGEIVEWLGFAMMSWSLVGAIYALWVALPLFTQALVVHRWYQEQFPDAYPPERKAIVPGIV